MVRRSAERNLNFRLFSGASIRNKFSLKNQCQHRSSESTVQEENDYFNLLSFVGWHSSGQKAGGVAWGTDQHLQRLAAGPQQDPHQEGHLLQLTGGRVECFIGYNTTLPSFAAVERMFSSAGKILRVKRFSLTASNFLKVGFHVWQHGAAGVQDGEGALTAKCGAHAPSWKTKRTARINIC